MDGLPELGLGHRRWRPALALLKRFGSVTVLNGHIHQVMQKVEGNVTFHTARSTAFPQPAPGTAPSPGPMKVADDKLRALLGVASINFKPGDQRLAIIDTPLQGVQHRTMTMRIVRFPGLCAWVACCASLRLCDCGCGRIAHAGVTDAAVKIDNFTFAPARLTVKAGTTVTWTNHDDIPHTVAASTKAFKSKALDTDDKFSFTFSTSGRVQILLLAASAYDGIDRGRGGNGSHAMRPEP